MQKFNQIILALIVITSFNLQAQVAATLSELSQDFRNTRDFTIHKKEGYFSAQSPDGRISTIIRVQKKNKKWKNPSIANFSGQYHDIEPFIAHDGLSLLFASNRPKFKGDESKDYDIWLVKRPNKKSPWSKPINLGTAINSTKNEFHPSLARNNNLYFTANTKSSKGKDDIYFSQYKNGTYQQAVSLPQSINTAGDEYNAYIAADESYLIFGAYKRKDSIGSGDLYISYKDDNSNWQQAQNMGKTINSKYMDYCPFVDAQNQILYFTSKRNQLITKTYTSIKSLIKHHNSYANGLSRIYQTPFIIK